ncbi:MAG: SMI1/KNR4 family protein [Candidatus Korobacteraceae bacterium]
MRIEEIFEQAGRQWNGSAPASASDLAFLESRAKAQLPPEYVDLLRFSNGGDGPLAFSPFWLQLYSVSDCVELCHTGWVMKEFPDFMFFGSNGAGESFAFDLRAGPPWSIVTIDQIAGESSAIQVAPDMKTFIQGIGRESEQ